MPLTDTPPPQPLKLDAAAVQSLIRANLAAAAGVLVEEVAPGNARVRLPFQRDMLRPGESVSGPVLFAAADTAMYACVLAHLGPELMAVTADMTLHFLRRARPGDVIARARLIKLGRRLAVMEVQVSTAAMTDPAVLVTGTYALP